MYLLSLLIFLPIWLRVLKKNNINNGPSLFSSYIFAYLMYYLLVPALIEGLSMYSNKSQKYFDAFNGTGHMGWLFYTMIIFIVFLIFSQTYLHHRKKQDVAINYIKLTKYLKILGYISLFIGGASLLAYFYFLGGILPALGMAEYARSMSSDMLSILTPGQQRLIVLARLLVVSPYCFFYLYQTTRERKHFLFSTAAILLTLLLLLFQASRTSIAIFFVALSFPFVSRFTKSPWTFIVLAGLFGSNILNVLDSLFVSFDADRDSTVADFNIDEIVMQFSFAQRNLLHSFNIIGRFGCRYFLDLITSFLNFIPGLHFELSAEPTSMYFGGADWRLYGGIPNDMITYSILEGSIVGIMVLPYLIARIMAAVDSSFIEITGSKPDLYFKGVFKAYLMISVFFCIPSSDLTSIITNYTVLVFFIILYKVKQYKEVC